MILHSNIYSIPYKVSTGEPCMLEISETLYEGLYEDDKAFTIAIQARFHQLYAVSQMEVSIDKSENYPDQFQPIISQNHLRAKAIKGLLDEMKRMHDALRLIFDGEIPQS